MMTIEKISDCAGRDASALRRDEKEQAALEVLKSTGVDVLEAALVVKEALECGRGRIWRARECVRLGAEEMRKRERKNRRARTVTDFRYYCKRLMVRNPGLAERRVRSVTAADCRRYLATAFGGSAAQYRKARAIMSGVFSTAIRHDWCDSNPVARVEVPDVVKKPIEPLSISERHDLSLVQPAKLREMIKLLISSLKEGCPPPLKQNPSCPVSGFCLNSEQKT